MRSQRLVSCMLLLQGKRRLTARDLAEALEVSMRTVYRDVESLCEAGVPIHMERGAGGGIVLADDYRRALAQFTSEELQALFTAAAGPMTDLGIISPARALQKLAGALPESQRRAAEANRDRLLLDHNRWSRAEQPTAVLQRLRGAIAQQHSVGLDYRDRGGALTIRRVDPLGLVAKAGVWYLVAHEADKGFRTFRAERIVSVEDTGRRFERPPDFNLEAHWSESVASIESRSTGSFEAVVRVRPGPRAILTAYWDFVVVAEEPEFATLRLAFPNREVALGQLLPFAEGVHILEPVELTDSIVEYAHLILARYATTSSQRP